MSYVLATRIVALVCLLCATPSAAQIVVITQAKVQAGNITPGDRPGFPITITLPGRYSLGGNLVVEDVNKNGFLVTTPYVTIDFAGFFLSGNGEGYYGIQSEFPGLTVRNGTIRVFKGGGIVSTGGAADWVVEGMRITENTGPAIKTIASRSRISNSNVSGNSQGISVGDGALIENNIIYENGGDGVVISGGTIIGNVIRHSRNAAIRARGPTGFGNNMIVGRITGELIAMQPNACTPACP